MAKLCPGCGSKVGGSPFQCPRCGSDMSRSPTAHAPRRAPGHFNAPSLRTTSSATPADSQSQAAPELSRELLPPEGERLSVDNIAARLLATSVTNGNSEVSVRCIAKLHATRGRFVHIVLQAIDIVGFELAEIRLYGWLEPEASTGIAGRLEIPATLYPEVSQWRLKGWWSQQTVSALRLRPAWHLTRSYEDENKVALTTLKPLSHRSSGSLR